MSDASLVPALLSKADLPPGTLERLWQFGSQWRKHLILNPGLPERFWEEAAETAERGDWWRLRVWRTWRFTARHVGIALRAHARGEMPTTCLASILAGACEVDDGQQRRLADAVRKHPSLLQAVLANPDPYQSLHGIIPHIDPGCHAKAALVVASKLDDEDAVRHLTRTRLVGPPPGRLDVLRFAIRRPTLALHLLDSSVEHPLLTSLRSVLQHSFVYGRWRKLISDPGRTSELVELGPTYVFTEHVSSAPLDIMWLVERFPSAPSGWGVDTRLAIGKRFYDFYYCLGVDGVARVLSWAGRQYHPRHLHWDDAAAIPEYWFFPAPRRDSDPEPTCGDDWFLRSAHLTEEFARRIEARFGDDPQAWSVFLSLARSAHRRPVSDVMDAAARFLRPKEDEPASSGGEPEPVEASPPSKLRALVRLVGSLLWRIRCWLMVRGA